MMNSLRQKILFGYASIAALVTGLSLFSYIELRLLEEKIGEGERIAKFFDISLEIRRFEKNYFLYGQAADLAENREYIGQARDLLRDHAGLFEAIGDQGLSRQLSESLARYSRQMEAYAQGGSPIEINEALAGAVRKTGKEIVTIAEELAKAERKTLQAQLDRHRLLLLGSVVLVGLLVILIGHLLTRRVVRPLKDMEESMGQVASGRLDKLPMSSDDREIDSLARAFNHVLHELELRQGQLVHSEKLAALGTLLSGVAHELNNPLSNIATSAQILAEEADAGNLALQNELLAQIDTETWRAQRIVRSLLDYARDRDFSSERLPLATLVEDTLRLFKGQIPAHVTVTTRIADNLIIPGDRQRLQQVLLNLIRNAIEAVGSPGEVSIAARQTCEVRASHPPERLVFGQYACHEGNEAIEIEIHDNGHGIAADTLPSIFDPFFTTKEVGKGLGLGLFIVFEIIEEHGGCIVVESGPGKGTSFVLILPAGEKNV